MLSKIVYNTTSKSSLIFKSIITPVAIRFYSVPPSQFAIKAGPPKLPKEQQEEFEKLQQIANSQIAIEEYNDQIKQKNASTAATDLSNQEQEQELKPPVVNSDIGTFQSLKIIPEFEGNVNPRTGEKGGPKQDPLKHTKDEWSFNGRVIDF